MADAGQYADINDKNMRSLTSTIDNETAVPNTYAFVREDFAQVSLIELFNKVVESIIYSPKHVVDHVALSPKARIRQSCIRLSTFSKSTNQTVLHSSNSILYVQYI